MKSQKGFALVAVLMAFFLGAAIVGGGTYYVMQQGAIPQVATDTNNSINTLQPATKTNSYDINPVKQQPAQTTQAPEAVVSSTDSTMKTYTNMQYGFTFSYPKESVYYTDNYQHTDSVFKLNFRITPSSDYIEISVYPIKQLKQGIDRSSSIGFDPMKNQFYKKDCVDYDSGCHESTITTETPNITIGGVSSYGALNQSPTYILVPLNNIYGLIISVPSMSHTYNSLSFDSITKGILDSFHGTN